MEIYSDEYFMKMAFKEAEYALQREEIPVGAVIVAKNQIIARGHNLTEQLNDFTAHAEMQAFTAASDFLGGKYLDKCTLFVTLEPCLMCAGAAFNTRVGRIVFGAYDERRGYTQFDHEHLTNKRILHPKTEVTGGVLEDACLKLLQDFFKRKRN